MNIVKKLFFYSIAVILIVGLFHTLAHAQTYDCSYIDSATEYNNCCTDSGGGSSEDCIAYEDQYMANPSTATPQPTTTASNTSSSCSATNITDDNCYIQNCTGGYDPSGDSASCINYANASAMKDDGNTACASINSSNVSSCCGGSESPMCIAYQDQVTGTGGTGSGTTTGSGTAIPGTPGGTAALGQALNIHLTNPLSGVSTIPDAINKILSVVIRLVLPLIIIMFIYAGLTFVLARGNDKELIKAKNIFLFTIIGTLLILGAWVITNAIIGTVNAIIS